MEAFFQNFFEISSTLKFSLSIENLVHIICLKILFKYSSSVIFFNHLVSIKLQISSKFFSNSPQRSPKFFWNFWLSFVCQILNFSLTYAKFYSNYFRFFWISSHIVFRLVSFTFQISFKFPHISPKNASN